MFFADVFFVAVALAMDAFALTVANCTVYKNSLNKRSEWSMPIGFGLFQFIMPVLGFYVGSTFSNSVAPAAGYITAAVFFILGVKIVFDNLKDYFSEKEISVKNKNTAAFTFKILLIQAVATSIDAFFIGASSFAFKLTTPFICALIVGVITFGIVACALFIGKTLGRKLGKYAEWTGAAILFILSVKELIQAVI